MNILYYLHLGIMYKRFNTTEQVKRFNMREQVKRFNMREQVKRFNTELIEIINNK
jgi:hypothetical protein